MGQELPSTIQVIDDAGRIRYRLPRRNLGASGCLGGLVLFAFGSFFAGFAIFWIVMALAMAPNIFVGALFGLFGTPFVLVGLVIIAFALAALGGRSEVEFHGDELRAIEIAGPFWWTRRRPVESIARLQLCAVDMQADGKPRTALLGMQAIQVECRSGSSMRIAAGYPRDLLEPLANELAERCNSSEHARFAALDPVEVVEEPPESAAQQAARVVEQPASSLVEVEEHATGITLNVPPRGLHKGSKGLFGFALLWCGFMLVFTGFIAFAGWKKGDLLAPFRNQDAPVWVGVAFIGLFWAVGLGMMAAAFNMGRRRAVLAVVDDQLLIMQEGPFGAKRWEWRRAEIEQIIAAPSGLEVNEEPVLELQIHPSKGRNGKKPKKVGLLAGREHDELGWLAATLTQALGLPGNGQTRRRSGKRASD